MNHSLHNAIGNFNWSIVGNIEPGTFLVYGGACGNGSILTVAEDRLANLSSRHGKEVSIHLFGQKINAETYAITKSDLILKGEGAEAENMKYGSTLSNDAFPSQEFDFMLSNPPYGKSWETDLERLGDNGDIKDPRFFTQYAGDPKISMITKTGDPDGVIDDEGDLDESD
ncbi:MAG: N-6 DNA methylase [Pyrinomonadaceae bacterium]